MAEKGSGSGCVVVVIAGIVLVVGVMIFGQSAQQSGKAERSEAIARGQWSEGIDVPISRALVQGNATGCGEYRYLSVDGNSEYIVECFDGQRTRYYRAWPKIERISGPYDRMPTD